MLWLSTDGTIRLLWSEYLIAELVAETIARGEPIVDSLRGDAIPVSPRGVLDLAARVTPRRQARTATCGRTEAATRLEHAEKFLEVAALVADEGLTIPASACSALRHASALVAFARTTVRR